MAFLFIPGPINPQSWVNELKKVDPTLDIRVWPDYGNANDIEFALVWRHPPGALKQFPNLKCISSLGAGVDHIMSDPSRPPQVPIVRVIDPLLVRDMTQYITLAVLNHTRHFAQYHHYQKNAAWTRLPPNNEINIGVMGLGQLGTDAANKLLALGFTISGWSGSAKDFPGVKTFNGEAQFHGFLAQANILVNLLPLTAQTRDILNSGTFQQLPRGAYIINVARGGHLVDQDLITALDSGQLSGACLDVFRTEPLPPEHPFWRHPKIIVTPHIASVTNPKSVAVQIVENYHRALAGKPLLHVVDVTKGY